MKRIAVLALLLVLGAAARAEAKQVKFVGPHPIHAKGGGYCYIEVPHVHTYGVPAKAEPAYRTEYGGHFFLGDPVPHGYEGPRHAYNGNHPVSVDVAVGGAVHMDSPEYCYLDGPHFHGYAPPPNVQFEARGGVYYYVGAMPSVYVEAKPRFARVNAYYDDYEYARPVVVVEPPHAAVYGVVGVPVVGVGVGVHGHGRGVVQGGVAAGVGVHAGVEVNVPMPSVEVVVPGVIVEEHHHGAVIVEGHHHKHKKWKKGRWRH